MTKVRLAEPELRQMAYVGLVPWNDRLGERFSVDLDVATNLVEYDGRGWYAGLKASSHCDIVESHLGSIARLDVVYLPRECVVAGRKALSAANAKPARRGARIVGEAVFGIAAQKDYEQPVFGPIHLAKMITVGEVVTRVATIGQPVDEFYTSMIAEQPADVVSPTFTKHYYGNKVNTDSPTIHPNDILHNPTGIAQLIGVVSFMHAGPAQRDLMDTLGARFAPEYQSLGIAGTSHRPQDPRPS